MNDLYFILKQEIGKGNLILNKYENTKDYKSMISKHILDKLIRFNILDGDIKPIIQKHYGKIIQVLQKIRSGDYL